MHGLLDSLTALDWNDLEEAGEIAVAVLRELASDRRELRRLIDAVRCDPDLLQKCECHPFDDKIVLYDALSEKGFRVRFRLASTCQEEMPHNHRFSFTTLILRGVHRQTWYETPGPLPDEFDVSKVLPISVREEPAGSAFTIHHSAIHSTVATADSIALILRGPTMKRRATITHRKTGEVSWRYGEADENSDRRSQVIMPADRFDHWYNLLSDYRII